MTCNSGRASEVCNEQVTAAQLVALRGTYALHNGFQTVMERAFSAGSEYKQRDFGQANRYAPDENGNVITTLDATTALDAMYTGFLETVRIPWPQSVVSAPHGSAPGPER